MKKRHLLGIIIVLAMGSCQHDTDQHNTSEIKTAVGSITGRVVLDDAETGNYGFLVSVAGTSYMAITDDAGDFSISEIPQGRGYTIIVIKGNYTDFWTEASATITVSAGQTPSHIGTKNITTAELISGNDIAIIDGYWYINGVNTHVPATSEQGPIIEKTLIDLMVVARPEKTNYMVGDSVDLNGLVVFAVYDDDSLELTDYTTHIQGDTFNVGAVPVTVVSTENAAITTSFDIYVSLETGIPVIYIETENAAPIVSKEDWVNMKLKVTAADDPDHNFERTYGDRDQIRGRGNSTWTYPKKPYRIRFRQDTSMFGLAAARNWVLLANYKDATLLSNTIGFELGQRFDGPLFKNHYVHVDVVLNGRYEGSYLLTEHMRVGPGRVAIADNDPDYLVEFDTYYDEDPKFRTPNLDLPIMIKSPDLGENINNPGYQFVIASLNEFDAVLSNSNSADNNWKDIIDIDSFVDYIMINEFIRNNELGHPKSVFMCKTGGIIRMSHLWDLDYAIGLGDYRTITVSSAKTNYSGGWFFRRFLNDSEFVEKYKARWNEKYSEIQSIVPFVEEMFEKLSVSQELNNKRWYGGNDNYAEEISKLKTFLSDRIDYMDTKYQ